MEEDKKYLEASVSQSINQFIRLPKKYSHLVIVLLIASISVQSLLSRSQLFCRRSLPCFIRIKEYLFSGTKTAEHTNLNGYCCLPPHSSHVCSAYAGVAAAVATAAYTCLPFGIMTCMGINYKLSLVIAWSRKTRFLSKLN